jgi:hypothetical protein
MNNIVCKIFENTQYNLSPAFEGTNLQTLIAGTFKKTFLNGDVTSHPFPIFDSVDRTESTPEIQDDTFYIFPIFYIHTEITETLDLWKEKVKKFIHKNKFLFNQRNTVVCICDPFETSKHFISSVEYLAKDLNFEILVITANKKFNSNLSNVKVIYNDTWLQRFPPKNKVINFKPKRLYINLNRNARTHRCLLMEKLIDTNMLKLGYNSWGNAYGSFTFYKNFINPNTNISNQKFDVLDIKNLSAVNPNNVAPEKHCVRSFLYLNTESNVELGQLFFSEKVYKPIALGMPFITLGNPGTLQDLRDRGFITFNDWFDESYDYDYDLQKRIEIIVENIKTFSRYSFEDLKNIRTDMYQILEHNQKLYTALYKKNWLKENLESYARNKK